MFARSARVVALYGSGPIRLRACSLGRACWRISRPLLGAVAPAALRKRPALSHPRPAALSSILIHFAEVFEN